MLRSSYPVAVVVALGGVFTLAAPAPAADLDVLARAKAGVHRFATLVTAQNARDRLKTDAGIDAAIDWCRKTGVTKIYLEEYRDGYQAPRDLLVPARDRLRAAGITVSGCVTTTRLGKKSNGWNGIACYTDSGSQEQLQQIFEYAASLFDEIMIDDFWFTDCTCRSATRRGRRRRRRSARVRSRSRATRGRTTGAS